MKDTSELYINNTFRNHVTSAEMKTNTETE